MQQTPPRSGNLFPDNPQPQSGPRFASNVPQLPPQPYEPQSRMHQTGAVPVLQQTFGTGQLTPLHNTTPVTQLPPMSTMPVAQPRQAQQPAPRPRKPAHPDAAEPAVSVAALQGTPLMVHTVQGIPVAVTAEEMQRALEEMSAKKGKKSRPPKAQPDEQKKKGRRRGKFSIVWNVFAFIGVVSVLLLLLEWIGMPLLVLLNDVTAGGAQ